MTLCVSCRAAGDTRYQYPHLRIVGSHEAAICSHLGLALASVGDLINPVLYHRRTSPDGRTPPPPAPHLQGKGDGVVV